MGCLNPGNFNLNSFFLELIVILFSVCFVFYIFPSLFIGPDFLLSGIMDSGLTYIRDCLALFFAHTVVFFLFNL